MPARTNGLHSKSCLSCGLAMRKAYIVTEQDSLPFPSLSLSLPGGNSPRLPPENGQVSGAPSPQVARGGHICHLMGQNGPFMILF